MKKLLVLAVMMSGTLLASERIILKDSKELEVEVNNKTVLCSAKGYGMPELKINIAALDGWTILDHSNIRFGDLAGLPCMTAGACKMFPEDDGFDINVILKNSPRKEKIVVHRELIESRNEISGEDDFVSCQRSLTEKLHTVVGGLEFFHQRSVAAEKLPIGACK